MATLTIRDLDEALKLKLRLRAAGKNRSMEEEARQILKSALQEPASEPGAFVDRMRSRFAGLGDVRLPIEPREPIRSLLELHEPPASYEAGPERRPAGASKPTKVGAAARGNKS